MAVSLGKRKRRGPREESESSSEDESDLRARFQKAYEAKFKPLEKSKEAPRKPEPAELEDEDEDLEDSDWSGFSEEDDGETQVQVVAHATANGAIAELDRSQQRAYMSSKPPSSSSIKTQPSTSKAGQKATGDEDSTEAANLKNDLALQRLLKESHLLEPGSFNPKSTAPEGKGRLKALDMRLQDLGAKTSLSAQHKMPIAHRKGIQSKAEGREQKRRKEAVENGIVLEKFKRASKEGKHRERSVGGPTVGKFRGGMLKLSGKDVRDIQGPKKQTKGKKGRR